MKQHTINKPVSVSGIGLHTGKTVTLTFYPAPDNHGVKFQRIDLTDQPLINADVSRVLSTTRGTTIASDNNVVVNTVEHALSALSGLEIDNVLITVDGPEVPIMDGSALPFVNALIEAGRLAQEEDREYFEVQEPVTYRDEASGAELTALPFDGFEVITMMP